MTQPYWIVGTAEFSRCVSAESEKSSCQETEQSISSMNEQKPVFGLFFFGVTGLPHPPSYYTKLDIEQISLYDYF